MGPDLRDPIVLLSEQGKYSNTAYTDFDEPSVVPQFLLHHGNVFILALLDMFQLIFHHKHVQFQLY